MLAGLWPRVLLTIPILRSSDAAVDPGEHITVLAGPIQIAARVSENRQRTRRRRTASALAEVNSVDEAAHLAVTGCHLQRGRTPLDETELGWTSEDARRRF
jgi:hypothetical protein